MMTRLRIVLVCLASVIAMAANAQTWPTKPVKIIAVFPPGGSVDTVARIISFQLTKQLGQQFIVDNKGGASGSMKALKTPEVAEKLSAQGMEIVGSKPEVLQSFVQSEITRWAKVVKENKIKAGE